MSVAPSRGRPLGEVLAGLSPRVRADLATYAGRAARLEPAGVMRIQADGTVVAATVRVAPGAGLLGAGTVLGLRAMAAGEAAAGERAGAVPRQASSGAGDHVDVVVRLGPLRGVLTGGGEIEAVPPADRAAAWLGLAPPRGGWAVLGEYDATAAALADVAGARAPQVCTGLTALGFLPSAGGVVTAYAAGPWRRVSAPAGHVLVRPA